MCTQTDRQTDHTPFLNCSFTAAISAAVRVHKISISILSVVPSPYVCTYVSVCTYKMDNTNALYVCVCVCVHMYVWVCVCVLCVCMFTHTCGYACVYICITMYVGHMCLIKRTIFLKSCHIYSSLPGPFLHEMTDKLFFEFIMVISSKTAVTCQTIQLCKCIGKNCIA